MGLHYVSSLLGLIFQSKPQAGLWIAIWHIHFQSCIPHCVGAFFFVYKRVSLLNPFFLLKF